MTRRAPVTAPAPRIIYYPTPAPQPVVYTRQELLAQRRQVALDYAKWRTRFDLVQQRDRRIRRILLRTALAVFVVALVAIAVVGWLIYHAVTGTVHGPIADSVKAAVGVLAVLALISGCGCGCITIIHHHH